MADSDSILTSTKKVLGIVKEDTTFDLDVTLHINATFGTLEQLGIGPVGGFMIADASAVWDDFLGARLPYNMVKSYVYLSVRLLFDPPTTSYLIDALQSQKKEYEWRLNVVRESTEWVDPDDADLPDDNILDGGGPSTGSTHTTLDGGTP